MSFPEKNFTFKKKRSELWLKVLSFGNLLIIIFNLFISAFEENPENLITFIIYLPDFPFLITSVILATFAILVKNIKFFLLNTGIILVVIFQILGFEVNIRAKELPEKSFSVLTYNTFSKKGREEDYIDLIKRTKPDIFVFQEVEAFKKDKMRRPEKLANSLKEYDIISRSRLLIGSKFPITGWNLIKLEEKGTRRHAIEARVLINNTEVLIYTVHFFTLVRPGEIFLSNLPKTLKQREIKRINQLEILTRHIKKQKSPVIIAGDFNTPPGIYFYRKLSSFLKDSFRESGIGFGFTYGKPFPFLRIDYIFTNEKVKPLITNVLPEDFSDHKPLLGHFSIER